MLPPLTEEASVLPPLIDPSTTLVVIFFSLLPSLLTPFTPLLSPAPTTLRGDQIQADQHTKEKQYGTNFREHAFPIP
jgi:hypothetical protein